MENVSDYIAIKQE